ncbi:nucleotide exchange factor GrpE [Streptomyces sp. NPDC056486]|uniref:nucleotide exchange factor GrpE n=1 Tax=Streptomyces sp. NPDC056486 TaxID=3345835 RepID=UPI00369264BB
MPSYPQEPDRATSAEPALEGAARPPGEDSRQPGPPPRPQATNDEPGPDAAPAPAVDQHTAAMQELEDRWRRALADLDNLRKRHARELERERTVERSRTAAAFLPVLDNLELALAHADVDADSGAVVEGIRAVRDQAVNVLELLGYPRHAETGVAFDPARHEVVSVVDDPDVEPGTVVQVLRPGYGDGDRQLRPASVTVAKLE